MDLDAIMERSCGRIPLAIPPLPAAFGTGHRLWQAMPRHCRRFLTAIVRPAAS